MTDKHPDITAALDALKLTVKSEFVPFSRSRNRDEKHDGKTRYSLNWKVTLVRDGRDVLTTDYGAGIAHAPGYAATRPHTSFQAPDFKNYGGKPYPGTSSAYRKATPAEALNFYREAIAAAECESGFPMELDPYGRGPLNTFKRKPKGEAIQPDPLDVVYSLISDSNVLDYGGFEGWAAEYGYDTDSRSAESTYRACLEIALQLRAAIGEAGIASLQTAFQDY
jgi:hypothetical protein